MISMGDGVFVKVKSGLFSFLVIQRLLKFQFDHLTIISFIISINFNIAKCKMVGFIFKIILNIHSFVKIILYVNFKKNCTF